MNPAETTGLDTFQFEIIPEGVFDPPFVVIDENYYGLRCVLNESPEIDIEKAKVDWDPDDKGCDIHIHGKLYLPEGFWVDNMNAVGNAVITFA